MNIIPIDTSRKNMYILKRVKKVKDLKYIFTKRRDRENSSASSWTLDHEHSSAFLTEPYFMNEWMVSF